MVDSEFGRFDEVEVQVLYGPHPGQPASTAYVTTVPGPGSDDPPWDEAETLSQLLGLTRSANGLQVAHDLSVSRRHFSWGADASTAQVLLYITEHLLDEATAAAVGAATTGTLRTVAERIRSRRSDRSPANRPAELRDYRTAAIAALTRVYNDVLGPDPDLDLQLREETLTGRRWEGRFRARDGSRYDVWLGPDHDADPTRIARHAPPRHARREHAQSAASEGPGQDAAPEPDALT